MGTLLTFRPKPEEAQAKTEAILNRIGELYQQKLKAREELPVVLAELIAAGETDFALRAMVLWGTGEMEPHEILHLSQQYAAAAGVRSVADKPFETY